MRVLPLLLIAGLTVASHPGARQTSPAGSAAALVPGPAIVLGRVVEAGTTTGVPNAGVVLFGPPLGTTSNVFTDGTPGGPRRVLADAGGHFVFRDVPAGSYTVGTDAPGFYQGAYGQDRLIQIRRPLDLTRRLEVLATDRPVSITIQMWRPAGVSGIVRDEGGDPIAGVPVSILSRVTDWNGPAMEGRGTATTDDRGVYHADVMPGDYVVGFVAATTTVPTTASDEFQRVMKSGGAEMNAYMSQIRSSGGVLPRGFATRVGSLLVSRFDNYNRPVLPFFTDSEGRMLFYPTTFHPSGSSAASASVIHLASGEERGGVNLDLRPIAVRHVAGRVLGPGGPVANISLRLVATDPAVARGVSAPMIDVPRALTDAQGRFTFLGVPAGTYTMSVTRTAVATGDSMLWAADAVTIGDADVDGLELTLQRGVTIGGTLRVDGSGTSPTPLQLRAVAIGARALPGSVAALTPDTSRPAIDESGRFVTEPLTPGPYIMSAIDLPAGWAVKSITAGGREAADSPFELGPSGADDVIVTVTDRINVVSGTVRDDAGQTVAASAVIAFPALRSLWPGPTAGSSRVRTAAPDRNGRYTIRELPAGEYLVAAVKSPEPDFSDPRVLAALMAAASRITLRDGDTRTQDLRLSVVR